MEILRCPSCKGELWLDRSLDEAERLLCPACEGSYAVIRGIPRFVSAENYAENFGLQWNRFRRTQLDSYSGLTLSRERFLDQTGWTSTELRGKFVLDAGCGAGRFAEVALSLGAEVFAIDYSSAVDACQANLDRNPHLHLMQADIYALPFADESFDYIYSLGVLQHTPDVRKALYSLLRYLKPGGQIVVDVYPRTLGMIAHPRFWLRPMTTRIPAEKLFRIVERCAPSLLAISRLVARAPIIGRYLKRAVPVANYENVYPLSETQLREWAVLDTYDWLAPKYDKPQTATALHRWLSDVGLEDLEVFHSHHLTARAKKPRSTALLSNALGR